MVIEAPYPDLNELLVLIGEAGRRMSDIDATEGGAGNISVYIGWPVEPRRVSEYERYDLPSRSRT
jgi:rhamnulose-1-phosphate aldolase